MIKSTIETGNEFPWLLATITFTDTVYFLNTLQYYYVLQLLCS